MTTLAGRAVCFSFGAGKPACLELDHCLLIAVLELVRSELASHSVDDVLGRFHHLVGKSDVGDVLSDPVKLLAAAEKLGLEGVVSKRRDRPYRSGKLCDWVKVKAPAWREAHKDRGDMFEKRRKVLA